MHEHQWEIDCDSEQFSHALRGKIARNNILVHSKPLLLLLEFRDGYVKKPFGRVLGVKVIMDCDFEAAISRCH